MKTIEDYMKNKFENILIFKKERFSGENGNALRADLVGNSRSLLSPTVFKKLTRKRGLGF